MKMMNRWLMAVAVAAGCAPCRAVMANPEPFVYTQPDGSALVLVVHGDEHAHLTTTADGRLVTFLADGTAVAGEQAGDVGQRLRSMRAAGRRYLRRAAAATDGEPFERATVEGEIRGLIILANFTDKKFSDTAGRISAMMNEEGYSGLGATGSARDYFVEQSSGVFLPTFDVVGPVELDHNVAYYGRDVSSSGDDQNPEAMIFSSVQKAVEGGLLDSLDAYDNDNDGRVDMVYVIYAGKGQADGGSTDTVWPHMYDLRYNYAYRDRTVAGKKLGLYACSAEQRGTGDFSGIGTFCHEYGHCLGLPDLYDVDYSGGFGMSYFSVMSGGSYNNNGRTPPNYSSFERYSLGWLDYDDLTEAQSVTLGEISSTNKAYRLRTGFVGEFFALENRQYTGWDSYLPSRGLMILHIDYDETAWAGNTVNDNPYHQRVTIVPADNRLASSASSLAGDLYPGPMNNTSFTDTSVPAAVTWANQPLGKPVTDIAVDFTTQLVTFNFGGDSSVKPVEARRGLTARVSGDRLLVTLPQGSGAVTVVSASGAVVASASAVSGAVEFTLPGRGVYIVRSGAEAVKVAR